MKENSVLFEVENSVAKVTLNEPESLNSLSNNVISGLEEAFERIEVDRSIRCVILTGNGKGFCSGGNIKEFPNDPNALEIRDWMKKATKLALKINRLEKPIIAAVNGFAMGAGFSLALACDFILASEDASFGMVFNKIGAVPDMAAHYYLPRLIGLQQAKQLMFTGKRVIAMEAKELGIVLDVFPSESLAEESERLAASLAESATAAIGMSKTILNRSFEMTIEQVLNEEAMSQGIAFASLDHKEGVSAFLEKRKPQFLGR